MEENNENLASEFSWKCHVKKGHRALQQLLVFLAEKCSLNLAVTILGILEIDGTQPGHGGWSVVDDVEERLSSFEI